MNLRARGSRTRSRLLLSACVAAAITALAAAPANAIIVRSDVGLNASVDTNDQYPAVVQLFDWDIGNLYGGGPGGLYYNCTGTLVNPRTILTAAHCVTNEGFTSSEDWGGPDSGAPLTKVMSFGVDSSTRFFNFVDSDVLLGYNEGGPAFSSDVIIHPSAELTHGDQPFPWTDTALIALNEPVADVNPMGMLLSPLTSQTHVVQIGYGTYGTGTTGQQGIGFRRLMGENMLGLLGSDADFLNALFPTAGDFNLDYGYETQVEYYTDFDNPNRSSANAGCTFTGDDIVCNNAAAVQNVDFFPGDALPREVTTAPGDSGGPLIADQLGAGVPALVIGNLSGGWQFFGTPADEYGGNGSTFYQPLFAVWQFLVQNDPYKYVGAKAGDGAWEDPNHWVQLQDPNLFIIDGNGNIVTGTPSGTECGVYQTGPKGGTVHNTNISGFSTDSSPYYFPPEGGTCGTASGGDGGVPTGVPGGSVPVSGSTVTASAGTVTENGDVSHSQVTLNGGAVTAGGKTETAGADTAFLAQFASNISSPSAQAVAPAYPVYPAGSLDPQDYGSNLPQSSRLLGPGSTGFVPENTDGIVGVAYQNPAQYFDVTLSQDGTTSLSTFYFEIDRLTMEGNAGLDVTSEGGLLSNIDIELYDNAQLNNDGVVGTTDIVADSGTVSGNGTYILGASVVPTELAAIVIGNGAITAGNVGTVGTMTVLGNVGVSSGGLMLVDADATTTDLIDIYGVLAMNGTVWFNSVDGVRPFWHQGGDFAYADSIVTDGMSVPDTLTGVLYPVVTLSHGESFDTLSVTVEAAAFSTVFTPHSPDALSLSEVLDGDRAGHYYDLQDLYGEIDVMEGDDLAGAFDQLLPNAQRGVHTGGTVGLDQLGNLVGQRLGDLQFSSAAENGGSSTGFRVNRPDSLTAAMDQSGQSGVNALHSSFTQAFAGTPSLLEAAAGTDGGIASPIDVSAAMGTMLGGWGGFFSASSINGQSKFGGKDNNLDGYAMMVGLDRLVDQRLVLGAAFSATETNVDVPFGMGGSRVRTYQGTLYGTWSDPETMVFVNGFAGWGSADISTHRTVSIGGSVFSAMGSPDGSQGTFGITVGKAYDSGDGTWIYPRAGLEYDYFHTDAYTETGSVIAMTYSADTTRAFLGRIGVEARGDYSLSDDATVHPSAHADLVGNLGGGSGSFLAAFAAAPGGVVKIGNAGRQDLWAELGAGLDYNADATTTISLGYDATLGRSEADYGAVTGRIAIKF